MLVRDVYEVLSSHQEGMLAAKISASPKRKQPTEENADSKLKDQLKIISAENNLSPKRKQPTRKHADSKSKHRPKIN
ncbi:hypothetical protein C0J52_18050 [Blattella germanica]|nr:hypothetical protein C0J52_18050 [Blattella germanica]